MDYDTYDESQIYELQCKATRITQGGRDIAPYFADRPINMKCSDNVKIRQVEVQKDCIYDFLAGLDDEFDKIRRALLRLSPLPKFKESFTFVRKETQRLEMILKKDGKTESFVAMLSKAPDANFSLPRPTFEEKENMHCIYCNGNRHTNATCFYKNGFSE
ncbi:hypothetical protein L3X38_019722 [Prunus dulcis]|uniref:Uncharacterized protein n=1 Tax=Prunus dulcis TaxID=3755 RepID=A0AAD4ZCU6_PRUDU|nr:hypothetical protein L3X38_019722 [Prunus dulcis]